MTGDGASDDLVVLDDQHPRHPRRAWSRGAIAWVEGL